MKFLPTGFAFCRMRTKDTSVFSLKLSQLVIASLRVTKASDQDQATVEIYVERSTFVTSEQ